jgi:hypothetical protein
MLGLRMAAGDLLRVRLVHAAPEERASTSEILRGVAVVTAEALAMKDAMPSTFGVGPRQVTVHEGDGRSFNIGRVNDADDHSLVEWQLRLNHEQAGRVVGALRDAVAKGGPVATDARRAELEQLRQQRASIRAKQSILSALVRGQAEARKEGLNARLARLAAEREQIEIDLAASEARSRALRRQMDVLRAEAEDRARNDPVQDQLKRVLQMRQEELERVKNMAKSGQVSMHEVAEVEGRVADVEVQLITRREAVVRGGDEKGDLLGRLANELAMIEIDRAEKGARLSYIQQRLPELDPRALDEKALDRIVEQYPTLVSEPGQLPPLYRELDKRQAELLKRELALMVSEVRVEAEPTTSPAP